MKLAILTVFALASSPIATAAGVDRIDELKSEIISIARDNQLRQDNLAEVRAELQPLVDELVSLVPARTEAEKKDQVVGSWRSLWSDMPFGPFVDYANVYQAVYADGFYYNISRVVPPAGGAMTGYLRGAFADAGDRYRIEFTRNIAVGGWLATGTDLSLAGLAVESGDVTGRDVPGPVGVQGDLQNTYVDCELRIVTGKSDGDAADSLFVLERAESVVLKP